MPASIDPATLSPAEQAAFAFCQATLAAAASSARSTSLRRAPPRLLVTPADASDAYGAKTFGDRIELRADCLGAPRIALRYLVAHELGHVDRRHPKVTAAALLSVVAWALALSFPPQWSAALRPFAWWSAPLAFSGSIWLAVDSLTMLVEWDADRRASQLTSLEDMHQGMLAMKGLRPGQGRAYDDKIRRLCRESVSTIRR